MKNYKKNRKNYSSSSNNNTTNNEFFLEKALKKHGPIAHNIVATVKLSITIGNEEVSDLHLDKIAERWKMSYNPKSFAAAKMKSTYPSASALGFKAKKIVCTGEKSEIGSLHAIYSFCRMIADHDKDDPGPYISVIPIAFKVQNIQATACTGFEIDLA